MEIICIESEAFYKLIESVIERLGDKPIEDKWISDYEAMNLLRISSKTTLQKLRDEDAIRFSQPKKKLILYHKDSINEYLDKHVNKPFDE